MGGQPLGFSIYGLWTGMWEIVNMSPQALINSTILGGRIETQNIEAIKKYAREQVILGSGVPWFLVEAGEPNPIQRDFLLQGFRFEIRMRRNVVGNTVERELLPLLAGEEWDYKRFPRITWEKDTDKQPT
jgi:hypothetical protein